MSDVTLPLVLRKRLVFGDAAQISALKALEEQEDMCDACDGEGSRPCPECGGTGKQTK